MVASPHVGAGRSPVLPTLRWRRHSSASRSACLIIWRICFSVKTASAGVLQSGIITFPPPLAFALFYPPRFRHGPRLRRGGISRAGADNARPLLVMKSRRETSAGYLAGRRRRTDAMAGSAVRDRHRGYSVPASLPGCCPRWDKKRAACWPLVHSAKQHCLPLTAAAWAGSLRPTFASFLIGCGASTGCGFAIQYW